MDNVLSVAFCHRESGTIEAEGGTRECTGAFCFFYIMGKFVLSGEEAKHSSKQACPVFTAVYLLTEVYLGKRKERDSHGFIGN